MNNVANTTNTIPRAIQPNQQQRLKDTNAIEYLFFLFHMPKNNFYRDSKFRSENGYRTPYHPSQGRNHSQTRRYRNAKRNHRPNRRWGNSRNLNSQWNSPWARTNNRAPYDDGVSPSIPGTPPIFDANGPGNTPPYMGSPRIDLPSPTSPAYAPMAYSKMPLVLALEQWNEKMETEKGRNVLDSNEFKTVWRMNVAENGVIDETKGPVQDREWKGDTEMSREQFEFIRDRCASKIIDNEKDDLCKICLVKKRSHIYPQCGHFCLCADCKKEQEDRNDLSCPICRTVNPRIQAVYM
jgi:hypothetical protein